MTGTVGFLTVVAELQIHQCGTNWIWARDEPPLQQSGPGLYFYPDDSICSHANSVHSFNLRLLWPPLEHSAPPERDAWALGHTLVEY